VRSFPTDSGEVSLIWFNNLLYDGQELREVAKPDLAPHFRTFDDYHGFLVDTARKMRTNLESTARRHAVTPLTTLSSGYDSPAVAVIAKHAGCERAATIRQSTSFWRGSDSGEAIAKYLGLTCRSYDRKVGSYPNEAAIWAASGYSTMLSWTQFDYPQPVCLFFIGCSGDTAWSRKKLRDPFELNIWDDLGMGEFRLFAGVFQCAVPFWGLRRIEEIHAITYSAEMAPWTLHTNYDRPIPRRIVEQAGVPRDAFAIRKKNTSHEGPLKWPFSPEAGASYARYLKRLGRRVPPLATIGLIRRAAHVDGLFYRNITRRLYWKFGWKRWPRPWDKLSDPTNLLRWAHAELTQQYKTAFEDTVSTATCAASAGEG